MRKLVIITFIFSIGFISAQSFIVFENNKKNKSLFDVNDPNSLVSILLQNKAFLEKYTNYGISAEAIHPTDGMLSYSIPGPSWEIQRSNSMDISILMRNSDDETFEDWYLRLTTKGDSSSFDPVDYESLKFLPIEDLKTAYNQAKQYQSLKMKPTKYFYDIREINLIVMDSTFVYLAKKSPYDNKHFITFRIPKADLFNLRSSDINGWTNDFRYRYSISGNAKREIINKLREFQLTNKELDGISTENNFNDMWESTFNSDLFEFDYYESSSFDQYKYHDNVISKKIPGDYWSIYSSTYGENVSLVRNSNSETFEEWFHRLTTIGDSLTQDPLLYEDLTLMPLNDLRKQYDLCVVNDFLKRPNLESVYWVDYLDPMVYVNCKITKDSVLKMTSLDPYEIVFSERIDNKIGINSKPLILMAFGQEETGLASPISNLLVNELKPFHKSVNFLWMNILKLEKGRKINSDELKKLIHATMIDSNGIEY